MKELPRDRVNLPIPLKTKQEYILCKLHRRAGKEWGCSEDCIKIFQFRRYREEIGEKNFIDVEIKMVEYNMTPEEKASIRKMIDNNYIIHKKDIYLYVEVGQYDGIKHTKYIERYPLGIYELIVKYELDAYLNRKSSTIAKYRSN